MAGPNGHSTHDRTDLDALKAAIDLAAFIQEHGVLLKKVGDNWRGLCPFHNETSPSFVVNPDKQLWNCFGCRQAGDVFNFLKLKEGMDFPQALEYLRGRIGLPAAPAPPPAERPAAVEKVETFPGGFTRHQLLERVTEIYRHQLAETKAARTYLRQRGLDAPELVEAFEIGFCDGETVLNMLPADGELRAAMTQLGVVTEKGRELMSGSIVVPLRHPDGGIVGLYGRKISPQAQVSHLYLRGPQRGILNWPALNASGKIYLTESVLDALSLWAAGVRDVTCLYGVKGLHRDLEAALGQFSIEEVRFCLDADAAGEEATLRVATQLAARGIRCVQVKLPEGMDPNGVLVSQGAPALRDACQKPHRIELPAQTPPTEEPSVEETPSGFMVRFGEVCYGVTLQGPFTGKLRAVVRPTCGDKILSDNGDLYSHRIRMNIASQVARHFELSKEEAERHMLCVLQTAERWVNTQQEAKSAASQQLTAAPPMQDGEREEALAFLRRPDLVAAVLEDMETLGYAGESNGKLLAYLIGISRKLEQPLSGIIRSQSGAGKSSMAELVERLTPPEEVVAFARLSTQALHYEQKDFLKRKLLILEERVGAEQADYSIRVLQSRSKLSQASVVKDPTTGRMYTEHFEVEGPIAYLETTTSAHINHENATRCFEIHLDESEEQTRRIHQQQRADRMEGAKKRSTEAVYRRHHNAQRLLGPVTVYLPFASLMSFPTRWLRTRRDHQRFLCLIEAAAFLHQHQREGGSEEIEGEQRRFIRASLADYRLAYNLAKDVLHITLHELSRDACELWAAAKAMAIQRAADKAPAYFTRKDLRAHTDWEDHRLRDAVNELVEMEYLDKLGGSQGKTYHYHLNDHSDGEPVSLRELTTPEQLEVRMRGAGMKV